MWWSTRDFSPLSESIIQITIIDRSRCQTLWIFNQIEIFKRFFFFSSKIVTCLLFFLSKLLATKWHIIRARSLHLFEKFICFENSTNSRRPFLLLEQVFLCALEIILRRQLFVRRKSQLLISVWRINKQRMIYERFIKFRCSAVA